jgi:predicted RNase H-like HicB family nuclease
MSSNNYIFINRKTLEVYYGFWDCGQPDLIGVGKTLEEAVDIAENFIEEELAGILEDGIRFIGKGGDKK